MLLTAAIICLTGVIYMNELQASTVDTNNYVASSFVTTGHQIPPQQQFSVSITYATGLLYFPIAIISLSLLSVLIFQIIFWVRGCFHFICPKTCECYYNNESASVSDPAQRKAMHSRAIYWFFTFLLFTFITNFFVFVGDTSLRSSGSEASESIVQSANLFSDINNYAHSISFEFGNISKSFSTSPCQEFWIQAKTYSDVINECKQGQSSATQLSSIISSIPNTLNSANDVLTDQGLYYKNIAVYVLFAVILLSTVLLFAAYFIQRKWLLTVAVELSLLMVLLTTLVGATLMFVVHAGADFCVAPASNIATVASSDIAKYYTTCVGLNPFASDCDSALNELNLLNSTFNEIYPTAYATLGDVACLTSIQPQIDKIYFSLNKINIDISCAYIYGIYDKAVNQAVCRSGYNGLFGIFIVQLLTATFLFLTLCGAIHFYEMWYPTQGAGMISLKDNRPSDEESL